MIEKTIQVLKGTPVTPGVYVVFRNQNRASVAIVDKDLETFKYVWGDGRKVDSTPLYLWDDNWDWFSLVSARLNKKT